MSTRLRRVRSRGRLLTRFIAGRSLIDYEEEVAPTTSTATAVANGAAAGAGVAADATADADGAKKVSILF